MDKGKNYEVRDISLASQGKKNMELAELNMGALLEVKKRFQTEKPLQGVRIGLALHVTKETGILVRTLIAGGQRLLLLAAILCLLRTMWLQPWLKKELKSGLTREKTKKTITATSAT